VNTTLTKCTMAMLLTAALTACAQAPADTDGAAPAAEDPAAPVASGDPTRDPPLLEEKLEGIATAEGTNVDSVMYIANFPPGSVSAHHSHPGWEYNYILQGEVIFEVTGQEPFSRKAGEGMYNQRGNSHTVRNASQTEPAQLVSVLIKDEGAPVAVNVP